LPDFAGRSAHIVRREEPHRQSPDGQSHPCRDSDAGDGRLRQQRVMQCRLDDAHRHGNCLGYTPADSYVKNRRNIGRKPLRNRTGCGSILRPPSPMSVHPATGQRAWNLQLRQRGLTVVQPSFLGGSQESCSRSVLSGLLELRGPAKPRIPACRYAAPTFLMTPALRLPIMSRRISSHVISSSFGTSRNCASVATSLSKEEGALRARPYESRYRQLGQGLGWEFS